MAVGKKTVYWRIFSFNGISYENVLFLVLVLGLQASIPPLLGAVGIFLMM